MIAYPMTTGAGTLTRSLRVIDSLQLTATPSGRDPADWTFGRDVIIAGSVSNDEAKACTPDGWAAPKPYLAHRAATRPDQGRDRMTPRILILGAVSGAGTVDLAVRGLLGDGIDVTLIDKSRRLSLATRNWTCCIGRQSETMIRNSYAAFAKPGVRLLRETITAIDAEAKRVTTDKGVHHAATSSSSPLARTTMSVPPPACAGRE